MKESVIMFSLRDHFLVLNILHISLGLFILKDTKNEILKTSSLKKNHHHRSTVGDPFIEDPHDHLVRDPSSLTKTQTFSSENLRFSLETPNLFIIRLNQKLQTFHRRPQIFIENPKLFIGDPNSLGVSGVTIKIRRLSIEDLK